MAALNTFLESFRQAVNKKYPKRKKTSDGTIGDRAHQNTPSEHNPDGDGTIDAWDMDVNLLGSGNDTGSAAEDAEVMKVIKEFMAQPQAQLVIYNKHIYNRDIGNWKKRWYGGWSEGRNPHDHHVHLQSKQSREDSKYKGDLADNVVDAQPKPTTPAKPVNVPDFPGEMSKGSKGEGVKKLQSRLNQRGYAKLSVDGHFGDATLKNVKAFQKFAKISQDGIVGPITWSKLWTLKIS